MGKHKRDCKRGLIFSLYKHIIENDWSNWYIEWYEDFPCSSKQELNRREDEVIRENGTINKQIAGRTNKEYREETVDKEKEKARLKKYREDNANKIKERKKIYREENVDKEKARLKKYHEENVDKIKERVKECYEENRDEINRRRREMRKIKNEEVGEVGEVLKSKTH